MSAQAWLGTGASINYVDGTLLQAADYSMSRFAADATDDSDGEWPSVPRRLPRSGVEGIMRYTSLDPGVYRNDTPPRTSGERDAVRLNLAERREQDRR